MLHCHSWCTVILASTHPTWIYTAGPTGEVGAPGDTGVRGPKGNKGLTGKPSLLSPPAPSPLSPLVDTGTTLSSRQAYFDKGMSQDL